MSDLTSDDCSFLWEILRSNSFHIFFCFLGGLGCLLPLCLQLHSNLETKPLRTSILSSPPFTYSCVASIALIIPLFLDVLGDFFSKSIKVPSSVQRKNFKVTGSETARFTFLNASERSLILIGMIALPSVAFLPATTEKLALIFLCCCKCQIMLVGGTIVVSLCRYDEEYWSVRSTLISLVLFSGGLVSSAFVSNIMAGMEEPTQFLIIIDVLLFFIIIIPCLIYTVNSVRWLIIVYLKAHSLKPFLMCSCVSPQQPAISSQPITPGDIPDHTFFPMVYTLSTIAVETFLCATVASSQRYENYTEREIVQNSIPFQGFLIIITTLSMRMVKFEVVQGLYALIESKKSYVRYISHELRTPLNSAFLGLKLLTDSLQSSIDPKDVERREILVDVNVACRTTLDILNDLLCFDKMESGILVVHKHEVPVLSFISDCVGMFSAQAKEANVTISYKNSDDDGNLTSIVSPLHENDTVFIDKFKMDQVLRNLISNALKFTPRGGSVTVTCTFVPESSRLRIPSDHLVPERPDSEFLTINQFGASGVSGHPSGQKSFMSMPMILSSPIRIYSSSEEFTEAPICIKGRLIIIVKDSGTGMLEKDYSRLFKEIVQFNPEVLQAGGGSGLGLWITKGIVDLHQGEISVYSEGLGYGSSFTVELPMERILMSRGTAVSSAPVAHVSSRSVERFMYIPPATVCSRTDDATIASQSVVDDQRKVYHLLIVDDSPLNRKMLLRTFKMAGHICDEAADGLIAVAKVKEMMSSDAKAYTAILMDFVMPNMDGPTATKEIRALGYKAPIFGVTGNTLDSDINYFIDSGADRILAKPFDIDIFDRAILNF